MEMQLSMHNDVETFAIQWLEGDQPEYANLTRAQILYWNQNTSLATESYPNGDVGYHHVRSQDSSRI